MVRQILHDGHLSEQRAAFVRPAQVVELELERVRTARGSSARVLAAVLGITSFLGLAVAKPWSGPAAQGAAFPAHVTASADPSGGAAPTSRLVAQPATWVESPFVPGPEPLLSAGPVRASIRAHDGWGVRAIVEAASIDGGTPSTGAPIIERWAAVASDGWASPDLGGQLVRALGVSAPSGTLILDMRVVQQVDGGEVWLDVEPVGGGLPGTAQLLWPPRLDSGWAPSWGPGNYRLEVLTPSGVAMLGVHMAGSALGVGRADEERLWNGSATRGGWLGLNTDLPPGIFVGVIPRDLGWGGGGPLPIPLPLGGRPAPSLDLAATWLDAEAGRAAAGAATGVTAYLPRAVVIGAAAPAGMVIDDARLVRLLPGSSGPGALDPLDTARPLVTIIDDYPRREVVRFEQPAGRAWAPGVYGVVMSGDGPGGRLTVSYVITLLPGSARHVAEPIAAARTWARFADRWGVAAGLRQPMDGPSRLTVRFSPQTPEPTTTGGADFSNRCLAVNLLDTAQPIVGISHPADVHLEAIRIQRVYLDGSVEQPRPAVALSLLPGLSIAAPAEGRTWAPGWYRLLVSGGGSTEALPVCVGEVTGTLLAVPVDAGIRPAAADAHDAPRRLS